MNSQAFGVSESIVSCEHVRGPGMDVAIERYGSYHILSKGRLGSFRRTH